jgi:putative tricarboxylic transport membrane protein
VFWGLIASMYVGNAMLLVLNLPLVGVFVSVLRLPQHVLATFVLLLCLVGAYSLNNSMLDLWVLTVTGILGYGLRKLAIDPAPLIVALVLGPIMEKSLRQTLFMARGDWSDIFTRPLSVTLLLVGIIGFAGPWLVALVRRRPAGAAAVPQVPR